MRGFIGIDIETTGLDERSEEILEIGAVLFDDRLNEVDYVQVVAPTRAGWMRVHEGQLDEFIVDMHTKSGLIDDIMVMEAPSSRGLGEVIGTIREWNARLGGRQPMMGSSVHFDRAFLKEHLRDLHDLFAYRNIDASSLWQMALVANPVKAERVLAERSGAPTHRTIDDVRASAETLRLLAAHAWL